MGNEYVDALAKFAEMKEREHAALARITNPEVKKEIANALGVKFETPAVAPVAQSKPVVTWRAGQVVAGNGLDGWQDEQLPKV